MSFAEKVNQQFIVFADEQYCEGNIKKEVKCPNNVEKCYLNTGREGGGGWALLKLTDVLLNLASQGQFNSILFTLITTKYNIFYSKCVVVKGARLSWAIRSPSEIVGTGEAHDISVSWPYGLTINWCYQTNFGGYGWKSYDP